MKSKWYRKFISYLTCSSLTVVGWYWLRRPEIVLVAVDGALRSLGK